MREREKIRREKQTNKQSFVVIEKKFRKPEEQVAIGRGDLSATVSCVELNSVSDAWSRMQIHQRAKSNSGGGRPTRVYSSILQRNGRKLSASE